MDLGVGGDEVELTAVRQGHHVAGKGKEGGVVGFTAVGLPENFAVLGVHTKETTTTEVGEAVEMAVVHDGGGHVQRHASLAPAGSGGPFAVAQNGLDAVQTAVFATEQHAAIVK